jgi:hypothetical protein
LWTSPSRNRVSARCWFGSNDARHSPGRGTAPPALHRRRRYSAMFKQQLNALPAEQRAAMMASKDEYIAFYSRAKDVHLAVSRETGRLLYMLARATNGQGDDRVRHLVRYLDLATLPLRSATMAVVSSSRPSSKPQRSRGRARISPPAALPISLKSVKAMRWKRWVGGTPSKPSLRATRTRARASPYTGCPVPRS